MASNSFGELFRITTWGESHGKAIGVVIDGCPAGLEVTQEMIQRELERRAPGSHPLASPRKEPDCPEVLSGVFEGKTTGTPISILIWNQDADSSKYEPVKDIFRPGHANFGYLNKYGVFDHRGGGRASARETACRVAAGAVAKAFLSQYEIEILAYLKEVGGERAQHIPAEFSLLKESVKRSSLLSPDSKFEQAAALALTAAKEEGNSLGGIVEFQIQGAKVGLGDPVYQKLEAKLASAMMSLPAAKGFEIGRGFFSVKMTGVEHNDLFETTRNEVKTETNCAGGVLGGISTGMPIVGRVAFKPTSSIKIEQKSVDINGNAVSFVLPEGSRHDPCVALRAPVIVEAMSALVLTDAILLNRSAKI